MRFFNTLAVLAVCGTALQAATLTNANVTNGVYFGGGNGNGNFTIDTGVNDDIEIALRAGLRQVGPITPVGNLYTAPIGTQTLPSANANRSAWNWEFSIDLLNSGLTLADITTSLTITDGVNTNAPGLDVLAIGDNAINGTGTGAQNSENMKFAVPLSVANYDVNAEALYTITLSLFNKNTQAFLGSTSIDVQTVAPEPGTFAILGLGIVGIYGARRRRKA